MPQSIFRSTHVRDYTVFSNNLIAEPSLSWRAKGILMYLLSKPQDWQTRIKDIQRHGKEGRDAVRKAIAELTDAGYINKQQCRDESGSFTGIEYLVFESPQTENPYTGNPATGNPTSENPTLQSNELTKEKKNKEMTTTTSHGEGSSSDVPSLREGDKNQCTEKAKGAADYAVRVALEGKMHVTLSNALIKACEGKDYDTAALNALAVVEKSQHQRIRQPQAMLTRALQDCWAPSAEYFERLIPAGKQIYLRAFVRACHATGWIDGYEFADESYTIIREGQRMTCDYYGIPQLCGEGSLSTLWEEIKYQEVA